MMTEPGGGAYDSDLEGGMTQVTAERRLPQRTIPGRVLTSGLCAFPGLDIEKASLVSDL